VKVPLGIGDQDVELPAHVCVFYDSDVEHRRLALRILGPAAADASQGLFLFGPPGVAETMLRDLEIDLGRSLAVEARTGRLALGTTERDPDELLENIRDGLAGLASRGYDVIRAVARVGSWGAPGFPLPEDHLWAESRVNDLLLGTQALLVCAYDLAELPDRALVRGGMETHPHVVLGDQLLESPGYLAPPDYLRAFLAERSPRT
jgi:hypothetical protein